MANLRIHLPREIDPGAAKNNLTRMLREKVSEGITRKVARNVSSLRQLNVRPFDAELRLEGLDFNRPFGRQLKVKPFDAGLDFNKPFGKQLKVKPFNANLKPGFADLDLNAELNFDY